MASDTSDDDNVLVARSGQISPGCPTADAVLGGRQRSWSPAPTLPQRTNFGPIFPPTQIHNPWTSLYPGLFILFQLDNRELENRPLPVPGDSESLEHCLAFPTKRYVGLVVGSFPLGNDSDAQVHDIVFVSNPLPRASRSSPECDPFTVPIAPTKKNSSDREPLRPGPFPWAGCYQHTVFGTRITPTRVYPSAIEYKLNQEDFDAFESYVDDDRTALERMSSIPDEKWDMKIPDATPPFPVKVWQELRAERECHDPREFVEEALLFQEARGRFADSVYLDDVV